MLKEYLERILLLLEIIDGIANGKSSFESCSLAFFVLLVISNTNKNINGIIKVLSMKYFASIKNCCRNKNNLKNSSHLYCKKKLADSINDL
jgi:hypothetical protein